MQSDRQVHPNMVMEVTAKAVKAVKAARLKKTPAAKKKVVSAKASAGKAKTTMAAMRARAREEERALQAAIKTAEAEHKKEEAKQQAVAAFVAKWEGEYERKLAMRAKKTRSRKKAPAKKAGTA